MRDVEAELGGFYPTVRRRLDAKAEALARQPPGPSIDRRCTIEALWKGEIDIDEASRHV